MIRLALGLIAALAFAAPIAATPAAAAPDGPFLAGALHPMLGVDHLLAMISVGLLSVQMGGAALWRVPSAFLAMMAVGGVLGYGEVALPEIESGIALSVFALGLVIASGAKPSTPLAMLFVGIFAVFHGYAHGAEIPDLTAPVPYVSGFLAGTATLHLAGVALGEACRLLRSPAQARAMLGAGVAGAGAYMSLLAFGLA